MELPIRKLLLGHPIEKVSSPDAMANPESLSFFVELAHRARTKEVVIGLGAEPRTMLAVTIVDWTTNTQLEHIYDRLLDRDPKTLKPTPMLVTGYKVINDTTWEFTLRQAVKFHNGEPFTAASVKATTGSS